MLIKKRPNLEKVEKIWAECKKYPNRKRAFRNYTFRDGKMKFVNAGNYWISWNTTK